MVHNTFYHLPEEKRNRILDAAKQEFLVQGFEKSSINRILDSAKVPKGSFYQYFDSKEDLFSLCIRKVVEKLLAARKAHGDSLLYAGLLRARERGYPEGSILYTNEIRTYLTEEDLALYKKLLEAPAFVRNFLLIDLSAELVAPVVAQELKKNAQIAVDTDMEYAAYLLSMAELLSMDYGVRHGLNNEDMQKLSFQYMNMIYDQIVHQANTDTQE